MSNKTVKGIILSLLLLSMLITFSSCKSSDYRKEAENLYNKGINNLLNNDSSEDENQLKTAAPEQISEKHIKDAEKISEFFKQKYDEKVVAKVNDITISELCVQWYMLDQNVDRQKAIDVTVKYAAFADYFDLLGMELKQEDIEKDVKPFLEANNKSESVFIDEYKQVLTEEEYKNFFNMHKQFLLIQEKAGSIYDIQYDEINNVGKISVDIPKAQKLVDEYHENIRKNEKIDPVGDENIIFKLIKLNMSKRYCINAFAAQDEAIDLYDEYILEQSDIQYFN